VQLLVVDTTPGTELSVTGRTVGLEGSEFFQMMVRDATDLIRTNREIRAWFDDDMPARALTQGAGQIRPLGRVAVYANAAEARKRIQQVINSARGIDAVRSAVARGYNVEGEDLQVNVICSLSGGTGSGMWYDLAYFFREQLSDIDSMVGAGILDGDVVVVRGQADAGDGQIVAALLPGPAEDEATVKRLRRHGGHVTLVPENPTLAPFDMPEGGRIVGTVVAVQRRLPA
jgi:hypothetical protein